MIYIPQEILTMICNYCGHTIEQKQMIIWKSIIPHRDEKIFTFDIPPFQSGYVIYWFTNKKILDGLNVDWMFPNGNRVMNYPMPIGNRVMREGRLLSSITHYLSNQ